MLAFLLGAVCLLLVAFALCRAACDDDGRPLVQEGHEHEDGTRQNWRMN